MKAIIRDLEEAEAGGNQGTPGRRRRNRVSDSCEEEGAIDIYGDVFMCV